ncbi:MAG: hypothetical protein ACYC7L_13180 [Nitrospirota bacterium]
MTMISRWNILTDAVLRRYLVLAYGAYLLSERMGTFRMLPGTWTEALHSLPSRVFSLLFSLLALAGIVTAIRKSAGRERIGRVLLHCSVLILAAGLWTSYYTRFEGKTIRAEGETFNAFPSDYIRESVHRSAYAKFPQVGITLRRLDPVTAADARRLARVDADIFYAGRTTGRVLEGRLSSRWPLISDWTTIVITDFGYMPKYVLSDLKERPLETNKVYLKLYPPGAEEYFRTQFLGYLFYLRCYPDHFDDQGTPGSLSALPKNPVFNLRIVRNKDIVYNGLVKPAEKVRFDNAVIALPEVKMWVEMSFVRDPGLPVIAAGLILLLAGVIVLYGRGGHRAEIR